MGSVPFFLFLFGLYWFWLWMVNEDIVVNPLAGCCDGVGLMLQHFFLLLLLVCERKRGQKSNQSRIDFLILPERYSPNLTSSACLLNSKMHFARSTTFKVPYVTLWSYMSPLYFEILKRGVQHQFWGLPFAICAHIYSAGILETNYYWSDSVTFNSFFYHRHCQGSGESSCQSSPAA